MRQGQQNRRGRGRNNNHNNNHNNGQRKGQNPLARSYESSGPDVKLRGTPAHIAEKYMALARDAQSSGDPVLAENYLQHAEHYNRIIMAYREQQIAQGGGDPGFGGQPRSRMQFGSEVSDQGGEFGDDEADDLGSGSMQQPMGLGEQPSTAMPQRNEGGLRSEGRPQREPRRHDNNSRGDNPRFQPRDRHQGEGRGNFQDRGDRGERHERSERQHGAERMERPERDERPERPERLERSDRPERADRPVRADRPERTDRPERSERPERIERPERSDRSSQPEDGVQNDAPPRRRERFQPSTLQSHEQPEFLRRSVRRPRRDETSEAAPQPAPAAADEQD